MEAECNVIALPCWSSCRADVKVCPAWVDSILYVLVILATLCGSFYKDLICPETGKSRVVDTNFSLGHGLWLQVAWEQSYSLSILLSIFVYLCFSICAFVWHRWRGAEVQCWSCSFAWMYSLFGLTDYCLDKRKAWGFLFTALCHCPLPDSGSWFRCFRLGDCYGEIEAVTL